jgi:redox-sensitive bicupin YhaK (pirin superfamily)
MLYIRRSEDRAHAKHGWLDSYHTFSFADYHDPKFMGFSVLRVINEDRITGGNGFPTHPHRDMEIITYIIEGALKHKDTLGTEAVIKPGDVQRMSAGSGIRRSEANASETESTHLLQIWLLTEKNGIPPSYEQKNFTSVLARGALTLVASRDGRDGSITVHQNVDLYSARPLKGTEFEHKISQGRSCWVQVVKGQLKLKDGEKLRVGDGLAVSGETHVAIEALTDAEFLLFDLP